MTEVVKTVCICGMWCGVNVYVEDGRIVKVEGMREHPVSQGLQCPKGMAALEYTYSHRRLKYPMRRTEIGWQRISWDEALDEMAMKLNDIKEKYGARALIVLRGMTAAGLEPIAGWGLRRRFCDVYGTPNYSSVDAMCFFPHMMAYNLTYGRYYAPDPTVFTSRMIVIWGKNVDNSGPHLARKLRQAIKRGTKLIVIDPTRIPLAKEADIHMQPRPGTDCALALGMLYVIISEELYDAEFVKEWCVGFDKLREHIMSYPPEKMEDVTGVPAAVIREAARLYATTKPASITQGGTSLDQQAAGFHTARAICIMQAITGNLDVSGGFVCCPGLPQRIDYRLPQLLSEKPLGEDEYPLAYKVYGRPIGEGQGHVLIDCILSQSPYPLRALIADGTNPLSAWANSNKWRKALQKLDFIVSMSMFPSETTEMSHLVLPGVGAFEVNDVSFYSGIHQVPFVISRKKIVQFEECRSSASVWLELAKKMGYGQYFPWENTDEFVNHQLSPSGLTLEKLAKDYPSGYMYAQQKFGQYRQRGFLTPSKKVEIYSETMAKLGHAPLPIYIEPSESPVSSPEMAKDYPLILTTGARTLESLQSELHDLPSLQILACDNFVGQLHPSTAKEYGITHGEMMTVETKRGSIAIKAKVTEDALPGVVSVPVGWRKASANALTSDKPGSAVVGVPQMKVLLCRVAKKSA